MKQIEKLEKAKSQIQELIDELKKEQKPVAGWVVSNLKHCGDYMAFTSDGKTADFGFDCLGNWHVNEYTDLKPSISGCVPADPKEVEQRLIEEAKRRGFKEVVKIKDFYNNGGERVLRDNGAPITYFPDMNKLTYFGWDIFRKGKWAEIIEEPLTLNGKEGSVDNVCLSYRHDFGLLNQKEQDQLRFELREWIRAIENNY